MVTRDERQDECISKWITNKGKGTLELATGFGKTYTAIKIIKRFLNKNPGKLVLIVVPTQVLKDQWQKQIDDHGLFLSCKIFIINSLIKNEHVTDLLIVDEAHKILSPTFFKLFEVVQYKLILCLTATMERLDGKHLLMNKYCPIIDIITPEEAISNGWLAPYREYVVYLDVNLDEYNKYHQEFMDHFSWFDFKFELAMKCATDYKIRNQFIKEFGNNDKSFATSTINHAMKFTETLRLRKEFIYNHPIKIEIANKILRHRPNAKGITFSPTTKIAEKLEGGITLHSKKSKKTREKLLENFYSQQTGVIHTAKALDEGADIPGLDLAIILSTNSSKLNKIQRLGRMNFLNFL